MESTTQLAVCIRCRPVRAGRGDRRGTGGERLHRALSDGRAAWARREHVQVVAWDCLGACDRACAVSLRAPGKFVVVLGGLDPDAAEAPLVEFATLYARSATGFLSREERPPALRQSLVAQVPPQEGP